MYAVIETGGKQVKCELGQEIYVEKIEVEEGKSYTFDKVLLVSGDELSMGNPYVEGAKVKAECLKQGKGKKIVVFKYKPKKQYKNKHGHRQLYTKFVIKSIEVNGKVSKAKKAKETKEEVTQE